MPGIDGHQTKKKVARTYGGRFAGSRPL